MTSYISSPSDLLSHPPVSLSGRAPIVRGSYFRPFLIIASGIVLFFMFKASQAESLLSAAASLLIVVAALAPAYFWTVGRVPGLPIFPVFAVTFLWTFALPLVNNHPVVMQYPPEDHLFAGLAVSGFLALATAVWIVTSRAGKPRPRTIPTINVNRAAYFLLLALGLNTLLNGSLAAGWSFIPPNVVYVARPVLLALSTVAAFALPYLWGLRALPRWIVRATVLMLVLEATVNITGLVLVGGLSNALLAVLGFAIGRRRLPILPMLPVFGVLVMLHYGKAEMREKYWRSGRTVEPWEYPGYFAEWMGYATNDLFSEGAVEKQSFAERGSLVHLFLLAHGAHDEGRPYMGGVTYAVIPILLVPRYFAPNKPWSHEGNYLLSIYYGLQTREDTRTSTIGWGLFNESYANFGIPGLAALAVLLGVLYGYLARWTRDAPPLSARFLFAVLAMGVAFQSEFSASVLVTSLLQSAVGVVLFVFVLSVIGFLSGKPKRLAATG